MGFRFKPLDGDIYAQLFSNKGYLSCIYPMNYKKKSGDALQLFFQEFGVPKLLSYYGSK